MRRILTRAGIGSPRSRRSPQHRFRRQRIPQAGMLVQLDGSHHAWLEDRGPKNKMLPKSTVAHRLRFMATLWPLPIHSRWTTSRRNQVTIPTGRR